MATLVQSSSATSIGNVTSANVGLGSNVVAGNYLYVPIVVAGGSPTISSVTSTRSSALALKGQYTTATSNIEIWRGLITSSGSCTVTVTAGSTIPGNSTAVVAEITHDGTPVDGPDNTLDQAVAADPFPLATLVTTSGGIIFALARIDSNFGISSVGDSFAQLQTGSSLGRGMYLYRITTDGVSAAPDADCTATETGDSLTIAFYDAVTIRGSFVAGVNGGTTSSPTAVFNLDGVDRRPGTGNPVHAPGALFVGGRIILPELTSEPTGIANTATIFAIDNGSGKTVLKAIFGSGASQVIATEP